MDSRPPFPEKYQMHQMLVAAGAADPQTGKMLMHCCSSDFPPTKQMMPKLIALLEFYKASGQKLTQLYYKLQICVKYYYQTEGNCLFYGDAKEIVRGEMDYDMAKILSIMQNINFRCD